MTERPATELMLEWFDVLAKGDVHRWPDIAADDIVMRVPFSPPSLPAEMSGLETCRDATGALWQSMKSFRWTDIEIFPTNDPNLVFATAKSVAETVWGAAYGNQYCFKTRFRNGKVADHTEFFNPQPVLDVFGAHMAAAAEA